MEEIEKPGEKIIYGAKVGSNTVIVVKEYSEEARVNKNREEHKFIMSVSYLSGSKRGTVFLLTETGYLVGKYYEFSVSIRKYKLLRQTTLIDSVDVLFDQFENDYRISTHLQSVDFDVFSCGAWISKRFCGIHPKRTHASVVAQFVENRDELNYLEKLKQQLGRRDDPIERVISIFHEWKRFVDACSFVRHENLKKELQNKKRNENNKRKLFSYIEDEKTNEDSYNSAVDEVSKIKTELEKGNCNGYRIVEIKSRIPELKAILDGKSEVDKSISLLLDELVPIPEDTEIDNI